MNKDLAIFVFRNDLRLSDNTGLIGSLKQSDKVIPIYIKEFIDPNRVKNKFNQNFIYESLLDLDLQLKAKNSKLFVLEKLSDLEKLIKKIDAIKRIYINKLYHPTNVKQEEKISAICKRQKKEFCVFEDHLLLNVGTIKPTSSKSYKVYGAFLKRASKIKVKSPKQNRYKNYISSSKELKSAKLLDLKKINIETFKSQIVGGRKKAKKILAKLSNYKDYESKKDFPAIVGTTQLSAYINSGCVSIREVYQSVVKKLGKNHSLIKQLYWREFYYHLYFTYPEFLKNGMKNSKIKWKTNKKKLNLWKKGKIGIPIVDATMIKLSQTGIINNRCRMIVSNFLSLKLAINWTLGEKYFAKYLLDYDPILNIGNWQYMAQIGADTAPYLRILNPSLQSKKFDKNGAFIKKWLPEAVNVKNNKIHK